MVLLAVTAGTDDGDVDVGGATVATVRVVSAVCVDVPKALIAFTG
jgi:hypothetical protein